MKKKIYFVRHGESLENIGEYKLDEFEAKLSKTGLFQAETVASRLSSIDLDIVYTSHYERAEKTAEKIAKDSDVKLEVVDFAYEILYAEEIYGLEKKSSRVKEIKNNLKKVWLEDKNKIPANGSESFSQFKSRIKNILDKAVCNNYNNVAFVVHKSILKALFVYILTNGKFNAKTFFEIYSKINHSNTGLTIFEFSEKKSFELLVWNDHSHL